MRRGLELYRWTLVLTVAALIVANALAFTDRAFGQAFDPSATGGVPLSAGQLAPSGTALAALAVITLLGLAGFILAVLAFLRWREGVLGLRQFAVVSGLYHVVPPTGASQKAQTGYRLALWTILLLVLASIALAGVSGAILVESPHATLSPNGTLIPLTASQEASDNASYAEVVRIDTAFGVIVLAMELVLVLFVTQSLEGIVELARTGTSAESLRSTRRLVFAGVAFGAATLLNFASPGLGAVALIGPVLLLVACQRYYTALAPGAALHAT